jgi:Flp pilus assembly protein TadG
MTQAKCTNERGAIAVLMMLILTVIMGFAAMSFDLSYVRLARFEMKNATDAAAHAAINVLLTTKNTSTARTAAETVAAKNTVLGFPVMLADADVVFGVWDYDTGTFSPSATANAVQINGHNSEPTAPDGTVLTTFGRAIGTGSANIAQTSSGAYRPRYTMFEMDVTGSFLEVSCALDTAILADRDFLADMNAVGVVKDKIGMDIFTGNALNFTPLQTLSGNFSTIDSLWHGDGNPSNTMRTSGLGVCTKLSLPRGTYTPCPNGPNPLVFWPNEPDVAPGIPNIDCALGDSHYSTYAPGVPLYGGTNIGAGIKSGITSLNAIATGYEVRSIVVFTDGGPVCCEKPQGGGDCHAGGPTPCCADGTNLACLDNTGGKACQCALDVANFGTAEADAAHAANIDVYILAFGNNANWLNYAKTLARGRGFALTTSDSTTLAAQLKLIANSIQVALVK